MSLLNNILKNPESYKNEFNSYKEYKKNAYKKQEYESSSLHSALHSIFGNLIVFIVLSGISIYEQSWVLFFIFLFFQLWISMFLGFLSWLGCDLYSAITKKDDLIERVTKMNFFKLKTDLKNYKNKVIEKTNIEKIFFKEYRRFEKSTELNNFNNFVLFLIKQKNTEDIQIIENEIFNFVDSLSESESELFIEKLQRHLKPEKDVEYKKKQISELLNTKEIIKTSITVKNI